MEEAIAELNPSSEAIWVLHERVMVAKCLDSLLMLGRVKAYQGPGHGPD